MRKYVSLAAGALLTAAFIAAPVSGQTAQEVLAKTIEAQGGAKALAAVLDSTVTGTLELVTFGMNGTITMYQKEPNKIRMDIEVMGMVITTAYDGEIGWSVNPQTGATEQMPENQAQEIKRQALGNDSLLHPEKYGIKYEFKGKEKLTDKEYLVLEQTTSDGHKTTMYLDPSTYLMYKAKGMTLGPAGVEVMGESIFGDYRKEGEIMIAHSMTTYQDGQEFMRMTMNKVVFNTGLEDSLFKMAK